ncbi:Serine proteases, trypsin domain containing protein [Rhabdaerophilaceae bacterium]
MAMALAVQLPHRAEALGGSQSATDSSLGYHLVMVLSREGNRHGACTGTIVAQNVVLTAAHCVAGNKQVVVAYPESGSHVLQRVSARAIHPGYSGKAKVSVDLALVRLEGPLPSRLLPLPMDSGEGSHRVGGTQRVAGFGMQRDGDEESAGSLRVATVQVLPRLFPRFLRLGTDQDATLDDFAICTGDSGGPVLERRGGLPLVVGVIYGRERFGNAKTCGTIGQAVRLAPQAGWIASTLEKWAGGGSPRPRR